MTGEYQPHNWLKINPIKHMFPAATNAPEKFKKPIAPDNRL